VKLVACFAALAVLISPAGFAQEKKTEKKSTQKKKKAEPKQDWGRFNSNAKKDMKAMDKKKAAEKK
jgi:hypothetical protein